MLSSSLSSLFPMRSSASYSLLSLLTFILYSTFAASLMRTHSQYILPSDPTTTTTTTTSEPFASMERVISATGRATVPVTSDTAQITATVEHRLLNRSPLLQDGSADSQAVIRKLQQDATAKVATDVKRAYDYLKSIQQESERKSDNDNVIKISQLTTLSVSTQPVEQWIDNKQQLMGYVARNQFSFRTSIEHSKQIVADLQLNGVSMIDGVKFFASESQLSAGRMKAIEVATTDAIEQAKAVVRSIAATTSMASVSVDSISVLHVSVQSVTDTAPLSSNPGEDSTQAAPVMAMRMIRVATPAAEPIQHAEQGMEMSGDLKSISSTVNCKVKY